jgi:hypothetical protein
MQRHTTHYAAYDKYWEQITPRIVGWFDTYLKSGSIVVHSVGTSAQPIEYVEFNDGS